MSFELHKYQIERQMYHLVNFICKFKTGFSLTAMAAKDL